MVRILFVAALLSSSCGFDNSQTCGRGRCRGGTTCLSIFGEGRQNQGWNDPHYPNVENEWWCFRECPSSMSCAQNRGCLENPTHQGDIVCAVDKIDVTYFSAGKSCLCNGTGCELDQAVNAVEVIDNCTPSYKVQMMCATNVDCAAGTYHSGDQVPGARLVGGMPWELRYCPGFPSNVFGPWLPDGRPARMYIDNNACP